ncbi:MAG: M48 family metalloprotease [Spirosomaceae bacterium]|nr:M48 family metalloprotease [Spirosomataceae bacterium]
MKTFSFISESFVSAFGWTLLHAVWQGFLIAAVAAVVLFLLRRGSSRARYWTGIGALLLQVAASVGTFILHYQPMVQTIVGERANQFPAQLLTTLRPVAAMPWYKQALWFLQTHLDSIVLFWVIGASVLLIRLVGSWVYVQQLKAEGIQLTEARVQALFKKIADVLRIRQTVHLFESVKVSTPMVVGFIRPVVLLPVGLATGLTTKQIEAILAHELAHVKRFDYLVNLLQSLVEVVYFFHPALWWLSARVRTEREHCCDDVAVEVCGDKLAFAQALTEVESYRQAPLLAMAFASQKGALLSRVKRVLGMAEKPARRFNSNALFLVVLLLAGVSVYAIQEDKIEKNKNAKNKALNRKKPIAHQNPNVIIELNKDLSLHKATWKGKPLGDGELQEVREFIESIEKGELQIDKIPDPKLRAVVEGILDAKNNFNTSMPELGNALNQLGEALTALQPGLMSLGDTLFTPEMEEISDENEAKMVYLNRKIDSLNRLMEPQFQKINELRLEMEQHEFKVGEVERKRELIDWKKSKLYEERSKALEQRNEILHQQNVAKKQTEDQIEKQMAQFEEQIKKHEAQMQQLNKQMADLRQEEQNARQPVEKLEEQVRQLERMNEKYSEQMQKYSREMAALFPPPPPPPLPKKARSAFKTPTAPKAVPAPPSPKTIATTPKSPTAPSPKPAPPKK